MASMWRKTLAYLGLVEDYEDEYADLPEEISPARDLRAHPGPPASGEQAYRTDPSNVRRIGPTRTMEPPPSMPPMGTPSHVMPVTSRQVHVTEPVTFNDIEEVGERFRSGIPVIMNLAGASESVAKRMLDFASGLIYGLDGRIERVGDRVFLLSPAGVDVSSEERRKLSERGFFNQA